MFFEQLLPIAGNASEVILLVPLRLLLGVMYYTVSFSPSKSGSVSPGAFPRLGQARATGSHSP